MTDIETLKGILDTYGGDPARWPKGRADALQDVMASREGRDLINEAAALDQVLDVNLGASELHASQSDALLAGIMAATIDAPAHSSASIQQLPRRRIWYVGGAMAAALLIGVFAGVNGIGAIVTQDGIRFAQGEVALTADEALLADLSVVSDFDLEDDV